MAASQTQPFRILTGQSEENELLHQILVELRVISSILREQAIGVVSDDQNVLYADTELSAQKPS
jgi:hypothetical protein